VQTPLLVPSPGIDRHLDPLRVAGGEGRFLPTSPEYAMKKLIADGSGSIFQVCKAFRDEPANARHLPEFTMLEWYRVGADYGGVMEDCEQLCAAVAHALRGDTSVPWDGGRLDLSPPYERLSMQSAFHRRAGVRLTFGETVDELRGIARRLGCDDVSDEDEWDDVFFHIFLRHVEPTLGGGPLFLVDYPARMAALARVRADAPLVCERFELYAGGVELANAFTELTDPDEHRRRFAVENAARRRLGKPEIPVDEALIEAVERGLPECAGVALGFDRLIMLLAGCEDVRAVVPLSP
jgi:lysyl-tRNA synthetase class 2